ncbi:hypothetical protein Tco_1192090 [Tanacetum coccineum]
MGENFVGDYWNATTKGRRKTLDVDKEAWNESGRYTKQHKTRDKSARNVVVEKKAYTWNKEGKEYSRYRDEYQRLCEGNNLHFEVKKRATTQRRSLGRRPRTTWPGWKDTVNKKGSRDDCGYESKLIQTDEEAVKESEKEYIGMVKICYEGAQRSKQERPGEDVVGNSRGTAWIKEPQAFAKISVEVGDALDGTPRKKSRTARDLVLVWKATWKRQPRRTRGDSKNKT